MPGSALASMVQLTFPEARRIDALARLRFRYLVTEFSLLHWRSHADDVLAGKAWSGPCADLTSTVLDLATREGAALEDCYRLLVSLSGQHKPDHMVGCILTSDDGFVIVGDTTHKPYSHSAMTHGPCEYNRLSEAGKDPIWRTGVPWKAQ